MDGLINFFALRPLFTFSGLKVVWYLYLFHILIQLYVLFSEISAVLAQKGISWVTWVPNSLPIILGTVAQIAIVRVLLEVAASILLAPRRG
ncbi:MAG: hypothetical protein ACLP0B_05420 [Steroidobacteraceae bacterium]